MRMRRYFCLYLQERHLLGHFYRKFRASSSWDTTGSESLKDILQVGSLLDIERDFRRWLVDLDRGKIAGIRVKPSRALRSRWTTALQPRLPRRSFA